MSKKNSGQSKNILNFFGPTVRENKENCKYITFVLIGLSI